MAGTVQTALALAPPLLAPLMLFGGLFLNTGSIPDYFIWLKYISWFSYSVEVITVNQWENVQNITCKKYEPCKFSTGEDVIKFLNFSEENYKLDFIMMAVLFVGFRLVGYFCLLLRARCCSRNSCCC
ncbi:protein white [Octopus bimaculoides]|uniref:ABC-2 type transporter transmembrane domain-containing protein n=1 Tax=Octopus bimaculoides TaxID=37653 RepID=A0A0L8FIL9_OCTBM|nr:protein white [Octopus bimaculoides]